MTVCRPSHTCISIRILCTQDPSSRQRTLGRVDGAPGDREVLTSPKSPQLVAAAADGWPLRHMAAGRNNLDPVRPQRVLPVPDAGGSLIDA